MRTRYLFNQSPLYKLHRRKKLAELLDLTIQELNQMADAQDSLYKCFPKTIEKDGKKKDRWIERPNPKLRQIQIRLVQLLDRIVPPDYLHSGFRGRSYISNAFRHGCDVRIAKIDIRKFFPSAYAGFVYRSFVDIFECSPDVATVIARLTTAFRHLPTGGNSSTMISFFAFKPMFDEIDALAKSSGLIMSCCVDDMTFSGEAATAGFLNKVRLIVRRYGLKTHKCHCFEPKQAKVVTGVALTPQGFRLPNIRRKKLHDAFRAFDQESDLHKKVKQGEKLLGRTTEAAQIEKAFQPFVLVVTQKLNDVKQLLNHTAGG